MWHQEAMVAAGIRTNLYLKNLDPYNFNPSQFDATKKTAIETLQQSLASTEESRSMLA